jgi:ABC-type long-subunit fatty acid transport system fused permease/ATPase subunit
VVGAALIALHTGHAEDFFLIQLLSNVGSALLWATSIVIRWPLLGVAVGLVLGQKAKWRQDPVLLRAYSRASWVWVFGQYALRVLVYGTLWWSGQVVALGVARTVLSWPLVALTVATSGWVLYRALPDNHPGLRLATTEVDS